MSLTLAAGAALLFGIGTWLLLQRRCLQGLGFDRLVFTCERVGQQGGRPGIATPLV